MTGKPRTSLPRTSENQSMSLDRFLTKGLPISRSMDWIYKDPSNGFLADPTPGQSFLHRWMLYGIGIV